MAQFIPRTFQQIFGDMIATLVANSPINDVNVGSIATTFLEAAATEDDEQYFQMLNVILGYSLNTTTGTDLDNRAFDFGLTRKTAQKAFTNVTFGDTAFIKVQTGVFSGLPGASAGETEIEGDALTGFTAAGSIIIGRGTLNLETVSYSSITQNANSVTFNLSVPLVNDHGTEETIILSQGGSRIITAGTIVRVPASDLSPQVDYTLDLSATIVDGEDEVIGQQVSAVTAGADGNVPIGFIVEFDSAPFSTATVTNLSKVTNGKEEETDQELRDRIRDTIQSLSKGTARSILTEVIGAVSTDESKRVVSASIVEPTTIPDVVKFYIDDGTGFIPSFKNIGVETVVASATGGEQFLSADNVPIIKAFVETISEESYNLSGSETLIVEIGGQIETITFQSSDFATVGAATAVEVRDRLRTSQLFDARISSTGTKVRVFARGNANDELQVTGGSSNTILNFPTDKKFTAKLYKTDSSGNLTLLVKDGTTAESESVNAETYDFTVALNLVVVVDGKNQIVQNIWLRPVDFAVPATGSAEEVVTAINSQASGFFAIASSNGTKVRLFSRIDDSVLSKIKVIENWDEVWSEESSVLVDRATEFASAGSDIEIFAADLDFVYVGMADEKFNSIFVVLAINASAGIGMTMEYWDGSGWITIGFVDTTNDWQQDGDILFHPPEDWAKTTVETSVSAYFVRLQRNNAAGITAPTEDRIRICGANEVLAFPVAEGLGADKDYTLNRYIGQVELVAPLVAGDKIEFGSFDTRASVVSASAEIYDLSGAKVLNITIEGVPQTYTFVAGDFVAPASATAAEVVTAINANFNGITASVETLTSVKLTINKWNSGTFTVTGGTANTEIGFSTSAQTSLVAHAAAVESGTDGPFLFEVNDFIVVVVDQNTNNSYNVPLFFGNPLTGAASGTSLTDTALQTVFPLASDLIGLHLEMTSGDETGERKKIVNYVPITGVLTLESRIWIAAGGADGTDAYMAYSVDNGVTWYELPNPKNFAINGLVYGKEWIGVGVADGVDAYIITSSNGLNFLERANPQNLALNDVAYDGTITYAAVGVSGAPSTSAYIVTSGDKGVTWVIRVNPKDFTLNAVIHDGTSLFVTVGESEGTNPYMLTSVDSGVTWLEPSVIPADNFALNDVTSNGTTLYCAVGDSDGTDPLIYTATVATGTWTKQNPPNKNINLNAVHFANALLVAVGDVDGAGPLIMTSADSGVTWLVRTVTAPKAFALFDVFYDTDNALWVAVGAADGTDAYKVTSSDAITWNEAANPKNFAFNAIERDSTALSGIPTAPETYQILPSTVREVVAFWNIRKVTNLLDKAEITQTSSGTRIQLASLDKTGIAAIQVTGGPANEVPELNFPIVEVPGVSGYQYWSGLMQLAQWIIDGKPSDSENFPGVRAAGNQVEVIEPVSRLVNVNVTISPEESVTLASIIENIRSAISAYVNSLGVGDDVIVTEIVVAIKEVVGVFDVVVTSPLVNIAIADDELARVTTTTITID